MFEEPGKAVVRSFEIPKCDDDEVATETIYSLVSPGTELRVFSEEANQKENSP